MLGRDAAVPEVRDEAMPPARRAGGADILAK
mgnify:CR=1 FL=1